MSLKPQQLLSGLGARHCASPRLLAAALRFTCSQKVLLRGTWRALAVTSLWLRFLPALNKGTLHLGCTQTVQTELPGSRFLRRRCCGDSVPPSPATAVSPSPQTCISLPVHGLVSICACKCRHLFRPGELPVQPSSDGYKSVLSPTAMIGCLTGKQTADRGPSGLLSALLAPRKT